LVILILRTYLYMRHLVSLLIYVLRLKNNAGGREASILLGNVQIFFGLEKKCDRLLKIEIG